MPHHDDSETEDSSSECFDYCAGETEDSESLCESLDYSEDEERHNDKAPSSYPTRHNLTRKRRLSPAPAEKRMRREVKSHWQKEGVYVLRNSRTNELYIGKSNNVDQRIRQHQAENRMGTLIQEKPVTTGSIQDLESWERNEVLTRMYHNGMDSVRGWRYTSRGTLSKDDRISAMKDIVEKFDLCRRCGRDTHFAHQCFARSPASWCKDISMR